MENVALILIFAGIMATVGAHYQDFLRLTPDKADLKITCLLNEMCALPCPYRGQIEKASWKREDKPMIPILQYPEEHLEVQHVDYVDTSSLNLRQPEEGAVLEINNVQIKHQGMYHCSVTSSTEEIHRLIFLTVLSDTTLKYHFLHLLWILLLFLCVAAIIWKRDKLGLSNKNTSTSKDEGPDIHCPLAAEEKTTNQNGQVKETPV